MPPIKFTDDLRTTINAMRAEAAAKGDATVLAVADAMLAEMVKLEAAPPTEPAPLRKFKASFLYSVPKYYEMTVVFMARDEAQANEIADKIASIEDEEKHDLWDECKEWGDTGDVSVACIQEAADDDEITDYDYEPLTGD